MPEKVPMETMVSLLIGLLYATPLDIHKNKNLRNICLSQIHENIFLQKFLLIQYSSTLQLMLR